MGYFPSKIVPLALIAFSLSISAAQPLLRPQGVRDPGVRAGTPSAGGALSGLTSYEYAFFQQGLSTFQEVDDVSHGLGPTFNMDSCSGCHAFPAVGGSSPFLNPQVSVAVKNGATNHVPFFITSDGPVREARFKFVPGTSIRDGGVHGLFTITGRADAPGCVVQQPNFAAANAANNLIFRIPTPLFGLGLIESIPDNVILANMAANQGQKNAMGVSGHPNHNGNDGTIARFGWKAQNKSLLLFSGEAYNAEMGVTNELFPNERDTTPSCQFNGSPEDYTHMTEAVNYLSQSDIVSFAVFMRFLQPPAPVTGDSSAVRGRAVFGQIGCALCHTPTLSTGKTASAALNQKNVNLYSDLLVHRMGSNLADNIVQGEAGPDEFRTAPLWGLGQRIFFLHDGRSRDLIDTILAHRSQGSEASNVIDSFASLPASAQQDLLHFLRSL